MKYVVIVLFLAGFVGTALAQPIGDDPDTIWLPACPIGTGTECDKSFLFPNPISGPFFQSDSVAVGTIIEKESLDKESIRFSLSVDFYLKNYQPFDLIIATLIDPPEPQTFPEVFWYNSPVFNEGDLVFVYLEKIEGGYRLLPESFALDKHEVRGPPPTIQMTRSPSEEVFEQGETILVTGEVRKMELVKAAKEGTQLDAKLTLVESQDRDSVVFSDIMEIGYDGNYNYNFDTTKIPPGEYELEVNYGPSTYYNDITIKPNFKIWTPLKQFKSGIPFEETKCKDGLELVGKMPYAHPKCVKPESVEKLVIRGWATTNKTVELENPTQYVITKNNTDHEVLYSLKGATLENIAHDADSNSIQVTLNESVGGYMTISIPRDLIDAKMGNNNDDVFFLLIDGLEHMYGEKITDNTRIITAWFQKDTRVIEIIGTFWI